MLIDKIAIKLDWQAAHISDIPALKPGHIHLWCLPLDLNEAQQQQAISWLSDIQRDKYHRRNSADLRHTYLAGRYYLLLLLAAYSNCQPEQIQLSYSRLNKPYLTDKSAHIYFNFTDTTAHNKSTALLAFSRDGEVGVDIEALSRRGNLAAIVDRRFSAAEKELVTLSNGDIDPQLALCVWTRKEASGKATGQGINFKMNQRDLVCGKHATLNYYDEQDQPWHLTQLQAQNDLIVCVVTTGHQSPVINAFNRLLT